jgi:hypothetical protein
MKNSLILKNKYEELRMSIIGQIQSLISAHDAIEMAVEFDKDIIFENGIDEQDCPQIISDVTKDEAIVTHQGDFMVKVDLVELSTEKLIKIVAGLETSLESKIQSV